MSPNQHGTPPSSETQPHQPPLESNEELLQEVGRELVNAAPEGWYRIDLKYLATAPVTQPKLIVVQHDRTPLTVRLPHAVGHKLRELRERMYEPGRGTWFAMRYTVDPPMEYRALFNYDHDPNWWPELPVSAWTSDLQVFPRDPEHQPDWLRARLAEPAEEY